MEMETNNRYMLPIYGLILCLLICLAGCGKVDPTPFSPTTQGSAGAKTICKTARSNIGVRYKYGGTKPSTGFDCSGLLYWSFAQHGIKIPRTTTEQMKIGKAVKRNQLRPGDIVAFKTSRRGYHTGLYVGNDTFVHSPSRGKSIREDKISDSYWSKRFVTARRVPQVR